MVDCKPSSSPMDTKHHLGTSDLAPLSDPLYYMRLIVKLIYLTISRPDLTHTVHILSQFMQTLLDDHIATTPRVLRYIKGAPAQGIFYSAQSSLVLSDSQALIFYILLPR